MHPRRRCASPFSGPGRSAARSPSSWREWRPSRCHRHRAAGLGPAAAAASATGRSSTSRPAGRRARRRRARRAVPYDLVIVTLLAHQVEAVLPALQRSAAACIQFMFNTFDPERLQEAVGDERCSFGMPFVQADVDGGRQAEGHDRRGRPEDPHGPAALGGPVRRRRAACRVRARHAALAALPRAAMCRVRERLASPGERRGGGASWSEARSWRAAFTQLRASSRRSVSDVYPAKQGLLERCPTPCGGGHALVHVAHPPRSASCWRLARRSARPWSMPWWRLQRAPTRPMPYRTSRR